MLFTIKIKAVALLVENLHFPFIDTECMNSGSNSELLRFGVNTALIERTSVHFLTQNDQ